MLTFLQFLEATIDEGTSLLSVAIAGRKGAARRDMSKEFSGGMPGRNNPVAAQSWRDKLTAKEKNKNKGRIEWRKRYHQALKTKFSHFKRKDQAIKDMD